MALKTLLCVTLAVLVLGLSVNADGFSLSKPIPCNRPNEHHECGSPCQTECKTLGEYCQIASAICANACYCNDGFARDDSGNCIPDSQCPPKIKTELYVLSKPIQCNQPNEHYECGSACQTECETLNEPCLIANIRCNDACYCNKGFARDASGNCIAASQCPPKTGGKTHY